MMCKAGFNMMLDSGAYSAWARGEEINIKQYIKFAKRFESQLWATIALDVLPGSLEGRTADQAEKSAVASYKNLQVMHDAGVKAMPVFHQGENWSWLEKLIKDGEPWVGLSSNKVAHHALQMGWLDECFNLLTDKHGAPIVKTHGFGTTSPTAILRYPWFSVDSTVWLLTAGYGQIFIPYLRPDGRWDYSRPGKRVAITGVVQQVHSVDMQFAAMRKAEQDVVIRWLVEEANTTVTLVRNELATRRRCLLVYYQKLANEMKRRRYQRLPSFNVMQPIPGKPINDMEGVVVFAHNLAGEQYALLQQVDAKHRLLSYYVLRDVPDQFAEYLETGTVTSIKRNKVKHGWSSKHYLAKRRLALAARNGERPDEDAPQGSA